MIPAISKKFGGSSDRAPLGRWGILWPIFVFALYLGVGLLGGEILRSREASLGFFERILLSQISALVAIVAMLVISSRQGGIGALGFDPIRGRDFPWVALSYLCMIPVFFAGAIFWRMALKTFDLPTAPQEVLLRLSGLEGGEFWLTLSVVVLAGPFFEELFFRAFLQSSLERRLGSLSGWIFASVLFALVHEWIAQLPIFLLGLYFGYLYRRSRRLWVPWLAHALHNGFMAVLWLSVPSLRESFGQ